MQGVGPDINFKCIGFPRPSTVLNRYTKSKSVNVEAVLYLTFLVDPTAIKPKLTTKSGVRPEGTGLRKKLVNWHARCRT